MSSPRSSRGADDSSSDASPWDIGYLGNWDSCQVPGDRRFRLSHDFADKGCKGPICQERRILQEVVSMARPFSHVEKRNALFKN